MVGFNQRPPRERAIRMAQKKQGSDGYSRLAASIKEGRIGSLYFFHGEEKYLLESSLAEIRKKLCPEGLDSFNYRRYEGGALSPDELEDAVNTLPVFAERTLVEVFDYDVFSGEVKDRLSELFSDLPEYVCIVFVFDTVLFKPDKRRKLDAEILKLADTVEFSVQDKSLLVKWITRHFKDAGKNIVSADAEYLAMITGGLMTTLHGEIEKAAAYAKGDTVTREDIDAVVTPVIDAVIYKLTDALVSRENAAALYILDDLLRMREAPHKILYSISLKMRQLLAARVWVENGLGRDSFMDVCGIRYDFQAASLLNTAKKTNLIHCRDAVLACSDAAVRLNSSSEPENCLVELVARIAFQEAGVRVQ